MIARHRPSASAPFAAAARSASVTLTSDGGALVLRSTPHALRATLALLAYRPAADWRSLPRVNETQEIVVVARARSDAIKAAARDANERSRTTTSTAKSRARALSSSAARGVRRMQP